MPTYRFELARSGRAGCQTAECKKAGDKIPKNEFRVGTWTDNERIQAWMWRHWGCLTPKIISHMQESIQIEGTDDYNFEQLDGFEELSDELKDKVRGAIEDGHIPDEDWKGDVELNRPGKTGFRVRGKKADAKNKDSGDEKSPAKKRSKGDESAEEEEKPAKKKRGPKAKTDAESATAAAGRKKPGSKPGPKPANISDDESEVEEKPRRGSKAKTAEKAEDNAAITADEPKKRAGRLRTRKANPLPAQPDDKEPKRKRHNKAPENNDKPRAKRGRPAKKSENGNRTAA
ncbi:hypothetical protein N7508_008548 [Penicillium antarcticum]|uniref:uncharacterized protein n=1 Tax=Penicillium antarcticum TaxID=416450 RepID=UPI00239816B2|nr:uncharacterized protein N7508_008548 [Penicillium antarcticum]KAJ5293727.1 hypothetical protein N7508_008548 [Penicillium antarcticum]